MSRMRAFVLNGSAIEGSMVDSVSNYLVDLLRIKGHVADVRVLRDEEIAPCLGCFSCWLRTPGECIIRDDGAELPRKVIQSDILFLLTPVTFGTYSSQLKKALDRYACPVLLPFFEKIDGETHHAARYLENPKMVAIGVLPGKDEESEALFDALVQRNAMNMHTEAVSRIVYMDDNPDVIREKLRSAILGVSAW